MAGIEPHELFAGALAIALVGVLLGLWLAGALRSGDQGARVIRALEGERDAEAMLRAAGYTVVGRQVPGHWNIEVDGEALRVAVRVDLLVERDGVLSVAEVKTGARAPDPRLPATRRQLLEYAMIFGAREVLLVDATAGAIRTVGFAIE